MPKFPIRVVGHQLIEIDDTIWSFGGHKGTPIDDVYKMNENKSWKQVGRMMSPRSGFRIVQNLFENSILIIGGSVKNMNKPTEMWIFTSSWSETNIVQKESKNELLVYYWPVVIPSSQWPIESRSDANIIRSIDETPTKVEVKASKKDFIECLNGLKPDSDYYNVIDDIQNCVTAEDSNEISPIFECAYCALVKVLTYVFRQI